jgi:hypothetical protein
MYFSWNTTKYKEHVFAPAGIGSTHYPAAKAQKERITQRKEGRYPNLSLGAWRYIVEINRNLRGT